MQVGTNAPQDVAVKIYEVLRVCARDVEAGDQMLFGREGERVVESAVVTGNVTMAGNEVVIVSKPYQAPSRPTARDPLAQRTDIWHSAELTLHADMMVTVRRHVSSYSGKLAGDSGFLNDGVWDLSRKKPCSTIYQDSSHYYTQCVPAPVDGRCNEFHLGA